MNPQRLAIITSSFPASADDSKNAGVFVRDVARELAGLGHDVTVITPMHCQAESEPYQVSTFRWPGQETSLAHIDPRGLANLLRLCLLLVSGTGHTLLSLRRNRIDHVVAMWAVPSGLLALAGRRLLGVRYSVWALGSDIWEIDTYPLGRFIVKRVLAGADHLYADGRELAADVERICGRPCTYLAASRSMPNVIAADRPDLDVARKQLLAVARYHPHKGLDVLVDALGLLTPELAAQVEVHIFGDGPERLELERRIAERNLADWVHLGRSLSPAELAGWMSSVSVVIIPSRIESVPLIVLDAAQQSCPVIASDAGDLGAVVAEYGLGVVVPSEDPWALAAAIATAVTHGIPYDSDGRKRILRDFSVEASCRTLLAAIQRGPDRAAKSAKPNSEQSLPVGGSQEFDAKAYWEKRLGDDFSLTAVGIRRLGKSFNAWAYRLRGERFDDIVQRYAGDVTRSKVLDIGSGTGFYIQRWRELGATKVVGSDIASIAVDNLRIRFPLGSFEQFDVSASVPDPLATEQFDIIDAMDVLFHILETESFVRAIRNIHGLLRQDGLFIWTDSFVHKSRRGQRHIVSRTLPETTNILESSGFEIVTREPFFVTMNAPVDTRLPLAVPLWKALVGSVAATDGMGDRLGKLLYSWDRRLVKRLHESPSIEIMVCRKSSP